MNDPHQAPRRLTLLINQAKVESQYAAVVVSLAALTDETGWEGQAVRERNTDLEENLGLCLMFLNIHPDFNT